jgi:hypothetical protein
MQSVLAEVMKSAPPSVQESPEDDSADPKSTYPPKNISFIAKLFHAAIGKRTAKKQTTCKPDQTPLSKKALDWLTFVALLFGAWVYWNQLGQMIEQNKISRDSLQSVQRAFISVRTFDVERSKQGDKVFWNFRPSIQNDGNTPAIGVVNQYTYTEAVKDNYPESLFKLGMPGSAPERLYATSVPPKGIQGLEPAQFSEDYIFGTNLGVKFEKFPRPARPLGFFGWIVYRDVFDRTKTHLTEFCRNFTYADLLPQNPPNLRFNMHQCRTHNCTDEYCSDYSEIVSYAESKIEKSY